MKDKVLYVNEELHSRVKALAAYRKLSLQEMTEKLIKAGESKWGSHLPHSYVYALKDPTSGDIKYVGVSKTPQDRKTSMMRGEGNDGVHQWSVELSVDGLEPELEILEKVKDHQKFEREEHWIKKCAKDGKIFNTNHNK
jgi:hypothetical protein